MENLKNHSGDPQNFEKSVYLHVCNGGATFLVEQVEHGTKVSVRTESFGNCVANHEITTNREGITALRDLLNEALENVKDEEGTLYDIARLTTNSNKNEQNNV